MKRALISDIHSNLEALEAVLADIKQQGIRQIYCLGDIIGYGPNPRECIDLVTSCDVCLLGNHDQGALFDPEGFNTGAERAIFWTRDQLENDRGDPDDNARRWEFLGEFPRNRRESGFLFVHGSARNPLNEYVFPEDIYNQRKMEKIFSLIENHCFQGHTHVPGVFTQGLNFLSPKRSATNIGWPTSERWSMSVRLASPAMAIRGPVTPFWTTERATRRPTPANSSPLHDPLPPHRISV